MPKYMFNIRDDRRTLLRDTGIDCDDHEAARAYAKRVVRELQQDGYSDSRLIMTVKDAQGGLLFSMPFVRLSGRGEVGATQA
jgi:hypothetical protein